MSERQLKRRSSRTAAKTLVRREPVARNLPSRADTLPMAFSSVASETWDLADVKAFTIETVEEILKIRNVPRHRISSPSMEITVPAIEAMRYSPLRREIAALIASTMDRENADLAHPSFLTLLQQLTEDEVKILAAIPSAGRVLPVAHLWVNLSKDHAEILHRNIVPKSIASLCNNRSRVPLYIDNLTRLNLLHEPEGVKIGNARIYSSLLRQGFCARILENPGVRKHSTLEKRTIALTSIGDAFRQACLIK